MQEIKIITPKTNETETSMELSRIFTEPVPDFLLQAAQTPPMQRLKQVGMNCGCEYTSFRRFSSCLPYSRFAHSLRVGRIVWHFTRSRAQSLAGLFHDISTPAFSHVIDFLRGDHLKQEATEACTRACIEHSPEIQQLLHAYGLKTDDVCDYHRYPIADNDAPRLSSDRLEYTLGNLVQFGFGTVRLAQELFEDVAMGQNEDGQPELVFLHPGPAQRFAQCALECSKIYASPEDRYAMQLLAELLADAIAAGVLTEADLMTTEPEVLSRLCADDAFCRKWEAFRAMSALRIRSQPGQDGAWRVVPAKKRFIDPLICGCGRVTQLFSGIFRAITKVPHRTPKSVALCGGRKE